MPPTATMSCTTPASFFSSSRPAAMPGGTAAFPLVSLVSLATGLLLGDELCLVMYSDEISRRTGVALVLAMAGGVYEGGWRTPGGAPEGM